MFKLGLEVEEPEIKLSTSVGLEKARELQKNNQLTVWITTNCEKYLRRWEYQTTLPASCKTCMQFKKQQIELDMGQETSSKLRKGYNKTVLLSPAYLPYMQSTSGKMLSWMKHKLESRLPREISITNNLRYADDTTLMAESREKLKSLLMKVKEETEKAGLKFIIQKTKIMPSSPITSRQIGKKGKQQRILFSCA